MSRELRSRLATLVLLLAGAAAVWVYARREDLASAPRARSGLLYPGLDVAAITSLYLGLANQQDLQLERQPGGPWLITQPTREYPRQYLIETLLDNLARAQVEPVDESGRTLRADQLGLEPPQHTISFVAGGRTETLLLGAVDPLGRAAYARHSGAPEIVLVTRNLLTPLESSGPDFVDPSLLRGVSGPVTRLRVVGGDGAALAATHSGDRWTLQAPGAFLADDSRLQQLVRSLQFVQQKRVIGGALTPSALRALGLPDAEDVARGEQRGATLIEIAGDGEAPVAAWLAAGWKDQPEEVAAVRNDLGKVVTVPRAALAMLSNAPDFFREHHLLPPVRERAESVRIESGDEVLLDIRRDSNGRWTFAAPERLAGEDVDAERIQGHALLSEFLGKIDALEVHAFSDPPAGPARAQLSIGWTRAGEHRLDRVDLFAASPDGVPARTTERPSEGLLLPGAVLDLLDPLQAEMLRRLSPLAVDSAQWAGLQITLPGSPAPLEMTRDARGDWGGDDATGRRYGIAKDLLRGFRGFHWQRARDGAEHPFGVRFLAADGSELGAVRFRAPEGDEPQEAFGYPAAYALVSGHDGVELAVAREWIDRIGSLLQPPVRGP